MYVKKTNGKVCLYVNDIFITSKPFNTIDERKAIMGRWQKAFEGSRAKVYFQLSLSEREVETKEDKKEYSDRFDNLITRYSPKKLLEGDKPVTIRTKVEKLRDEYKKKHVYDDKPVHEVKKQKFERPKAVYSNQKWL